jgi:hypothetical protein
MALDAAPLAIDQAASENHDHRVAQRFLTTNANPINHNKLAAGHACQMSVSVEAINGWIDGKWMEVRRADSMSHRTDGWWPFDHV